MEEQTVEDEHRSDRGPVDRCVDGAVAHMIKNLRPIAQRAALGEWVQQISRQPLVVVGVSVEALWRSSEAVPDATRIVEAVD